MPNEEIHKKERRRITIIILIVTACLFVAGGITLLTERHREHYLVGMVSAVAGDQMSLISGDGRTWNVVLERPHRVRKGIRELGDGITPGDQVIVVGTLNEDGTFAASVVRILGNQSGTESEGHRAP